jgi:hypothetical protein
MQVTAMFCGNDHDGSLTASKFPMPLVKVLIMWFTW